ncbi:MAG: hypothetical protein WEC00_04520 [Dongiaceae bacterium]
MQQKNPNSPNPKQAPGHSPSHQSENPRGAQPKENFPGKAPNVYGDDRNQKPGQPHRNPKRDSEHHPDGDRRSAKHQDPDDQRRDQRQDPARRDERAHRPGQDRE